MIYAAILCAFVLIGTVIVILCAFSRVRDSFVTEVTQKLEASQANTWIIGGMMGSGKSTFARSLAGHLGVPHIEIDTYPSEEKILEDIAIAKSGWIVEANPWQIPTTLSAQAAITVFLDYDNIVNYLRLLRRGFQEWKANGFSWAGFKRTMIRRTILDLGRIVYLHGKDNRRGWREHGLLKDMNVSSVGYIRCVSPKELTILTDLVIGKRGEDGVTRDYS